jgi:Tol biopolymer transport system component
MLFQKARFSLASFFITLFPLLWLWYSSSVNADTINAQADFNKKEVLAVTTKDIKTNVHEFFEYQTQWLFERVPYVKIEHTDVNIGDSSGVEEYHPNFDIMEEKGYSYLLYYTIEQNANSITIAYILFDGLYQSSILSNTYNFNIQDLEKATKNIASDIYHQITGEFPFFIGKAFYTERSKKTGYQVLYSQDLNRNKIQYTDENTMITSPTYCQGGKKIFIAQKQKYLMNLQEINTFSLLTTPLKLPKFDGQNLSSPEISANCQNIVFAASDGKQSAIYLHSFRENKTIEVVKNSSLNTRPVFGLEGKIYYLSNKFGTPKIFAKSLKDKNESIISRGLGSYIYFAISPDFKKIAFVKIFSGKFYLGIMNIDGSNEILLKEAYIIEAPSWAPIGNNLIVAMQKDSKSSTRNIYSVSTITAYSYPLKILSGNIVQANWIIDESDTLKHNYH